MQPIVLDFFFFFLWGDLPMSEEKAHSPSGKMGGEEKPVSGQSRAWRLGWALPVPTLLYRGARGGGSGPGRVGGAV